MTDIRNEFNVEASSVVCRHLKKPQVKFWNQQRIITDHGEFYQKEHSDNRFIDIM